jgi:hypothetical protein
MLKTLFKYKLTKQIFRRGPTANTFFKTNYKTLPKTQNSSKKNKTHVFQKITLTLLKKKTLGGVAAATA